MKNTIYSISFVLILSSSILKFTCENLPFSGKKYLFWLGVLCCVGFVFALKNKTKAFKINMYDCVLILFAAVGTIQFVFFSKATIYSTDIWYYMGYLYFYLLFRNYCITHETTKKTVFIMLYFCSVTAVFNLGLMFFQWKHWIPSPNEFFLTTGMFFSPNQLGIYLSIGFLNTLFLWRKATSLWVKIGLGLCGILIFLGLCISESRGAFISLCVAMGYYLFVSKTKPFLNWKMFLGIGVLLVGSFYFLSIVNKSKTESNSGRLFTTQQVLKQIAAKPFGYGVNSFSLEYNKAKANYFEKNTNWEEMKNAGYLYKANNDLLELTFEFGIPWMILFLSFIVLLFWEKGNTIETQIGRTILLCLLLFSITSSIIITPIFLIIACIFSIIIMNSSHPKVIYEFENKGVFRFTGICLSLSFAFILITRINAENKLFKLYEDKIYLKGENQLQSYISKIDNNGEEYFMGGLTLIKNGSVNEGIRYLQIGFERSGKPSLGKILANVLQKQKKYAQAEEIYTYNKNVEPYRFEARMDLLNLFIKTMQKNKAKKIAREIIDLPIKIPSSEIVNYKNKARNYLDDVEGK